jgi:outer membrane protein
MPNFIMPRAASAGNRANRIALAVLAVALGSGAAQAQKFAIIDMQRAVLATSDGKKASQAINDKFAPIKAQLDQLAADIQAKQDQLAKNVATLSPAAAQAAQTEIQTLATSLNRRKEDAQADLDDEENKELGAIVPKLQQVINEYAAANQIMFVLDSSAAQNNLIYGDGKLNIITPVVEAYEKAVGGTAPAATAAPAPKTPAATAPKTPAAPAAAPKTAPPAK